MTQATVTLSSSAARRLKAISAEEGRPMMLRVAVEGGGHEIHSGDWDQVVGAIVGVTAA